MSTSVREVLRAVVLGVVIGVLPVGVVSATSGDEDLTEIPDEQGDITGVPDVSLPQNPMATTTIPAGCAAPTAPQMVFVGQLVSLTTSTATYRVMQIRAGTPAGYVTDDQVEVRYGQDTKFLDVGGRYLVGAASDPYSPLLISKVREASPLFGGDAVIGVGDAFDCPDFEDPIRTLYEDGSTIDTGVFAPLRDNAWLLIFIGVLSIAIVLALLFGVVLLRLMVKGASRGLRRR
jgi:hypothetical protein